MECLVLMALQVLRDKWETEARLDPWALREKLEMWDDQAHLVFRAFVVLLVGLGLEVQVGLQENLVSQDRMERMESLDLKGFRVYLDPWEHLEIKVPWENRAERVIQECQDSRDPEVIQVKMAHQAAQDPLAQ